MIYIAAYSAYFFFSFWYNIHSLGSASCFS